MMYDLDNKGIKHPQCFPFPDISPHSNDIAACELSPQTCQTQQMQTAGLLSGPLMLCTFPIGAAANRWCVRQQGMGRVELTDLKSVVRQFLLIWLNQWRQIQPIHNSGNLQILRRALTYIRMTSKHNFRGHIFRLLLLPASSCPFLVPVSPTAVGFHPLLPLLCRKDYKWGSFSVYYSCGVSFVHMN